MRKFLFIILLFLFVPGQLFPQNKALFDSVPAVRFPDSEPEKINAVFQYSFKNFDLEQGLKSSYVTKFIFDKNGALWFGTIGTGVGRYDGKNFTYLTEKDGLGGNIVQDIYIDSKNNFWFATPEEGVSVYNGHKIKHFTKENGLTDNNIWFITEYKGKMWFGSRSAGITIYQNGEFKPFRQNDSLLNYITNFYIDKKNNLWICTEDGGLFCYNGKKLKDFRKLFQGDKYRIQTITEDNQGKMYLGSYGKGLIIYDGKTVKNINLLNGLSNLYINKLLFDNDNTLWIATSGSGVFTYKNNKINKIETQNGITNQVILDIAKDPSGGLWFATYGGGFSKLTGKMFNHFNEKTGLPVNIIKTIIEKDSDIWFGTSGAGLLVLHKDHFLHYSRKQGFLPKYVMASTADNNGNIYLGTSGHSVVEINDKTIKNTFAYKTPPISYLLSILYDSKGNLWMGRYYTGLVKYNGDTYYKFNEKNGFNAKSVIAIEEASNGDVWFGTENSGAIRYNGKYFTTYNKDSGLNCNKIPDIYQDSNGTIWLATFGDGIYYFKGERIMHVPSDSLFDNVYISSILEDHQKSLWFGTSSGIIKFINTKTSSKYKNSDLPEFENYKIKTYSTNEGFIGNNCIGGSVYEDKKGNIWFGTGKCLTRYSPQFDHPDTVEPIILLNNVNLSLNKTNWEKVDTTIIRFDSLSKWNHLPINLVLPYSMNRLAFNFTAINLKSPQKVRYKYILDGFEDNWSPVTANTEATYSNLMPGTFTFKVMAMNEDGFWTSKPLTFSFTILPPWWQTTWFRILAFLTLILLIYTIIKFRERKLQRDKQKLEKIIVERTAEVQEKNETLQQANEEITTQRDEIEAQRDLLKSQKETIENIYNEVSQSIDYATRLQKSILPETKILEKVFSDNFILFKPKDKVSGDFYWWANIEDHTVITAADCTGHGVPGAFMSMLGASLLREIVQKEYITHTGVILRKLRKEIIKSLKQKGESGEQKDGMDMAIISIDHKTNIVQFSGANNPLYIVKSGKLKVENGDAVKVFDNSEFAIKNSKLLYEVKPDKMPIAIYERMDKFATHEIPLEKGDQLYMFSDGFADQFGGPKGKKFKYKPFKQLLLDNAEKPMPEQKDILEKVFENWKGNIEQVDDVVVVGIKI